MESQATKMDIKELEKAGFDPKKSIERIGSTEIYEKLMKTFVRETGLNLIMIEDAVSTGDYNECYRLAHTIKGSAATIGHDGIELHSTGMESEVRKLLKEMQILEDSERMEFCGEESQKIRLVGSSPRKNTSQTQQSDVVDDSQELAKEKYAREKFMKEHIKTLHREIEIKQLKLEKDVSQYVKYCSKVLNKISPF
jgi:HPt (histidine-containing phosphotransfer) domain-containing protein